VTRLLRAISLSTGLLGTVLGWWGTRRKGFASLRHIAEVRFRRPAFPVMLALAGCLALVVPAAASASDVTWTGGAPPGQLSWSDPRNWGGVAPRTGDNLVFPKLNTPACTAVPLTATCYSSVNDFSALDVGTLTFGCGGYEGYDLGGNGFTLAGGLTAYCVGETVAHTVYTRPITLSAAQSWLVEGDTNAAYSNTVYLYSSVSGASHPLTIRLVNNAILDLTARVLPGGPPIADVEVGPVDVTGVGHGTLALEGGQLNASDGNPVTLQGVTLVGGGAVGPLTSFNSTISADLTVAGDATFDPATRVHLSVEPQVTSQIVVEGIASLGGTLDLDTGFQEFCPQPGDQFVLFRAARIGGGFANLGNGATTQVECQGATITLRIDYTSDSVTATVLAAPGDGAPANTQPPSVLGSVPSYSCDTGQWSGHPRPTYTYSWSLDETTLGEATSSAYRAPPADAGHQLSCRVTATNSYGSASATSAPVAIPTYWPPAVITGPLSNNVVDPPPPCPPETKKRHPDECPVALTGSVAMTGTVTPGSLPVSYYFVYGPAENPDQYATRVCSFTSPPCQNFAPASMSEGVVSACVGPAGGLVCGPGNAQDVLSLYTTWFYRLEVKDAHGPPIPGNMVPFVPGTLPNPPKLDMRKVYNLAIDCHKTPCKALAEPGGTDGGCNPRTHEPCTPRRSVKGGPSGTKECRGDASSGGTRCGVGGALKITSSVRDNDLGTKGPIYLEGTIRLRGSVWDPSTGRPVGIDAIYDVRGTAVLHTIELTFLVNTDFSNHPVFPYFTLAGGDLDYGLPGGSGANYLPSAAGPVDASSDDGWSLCTQNFTGCTPLTTDKSVAKNIALVTGIAGIVPLAAEVSVPLGVFATIMGLIADDPPDHHYKHVSRPAHVPQFTVSQSPGVDRAAAKAASRVMTVLLRSAATGQALLDALQRYQGALQAHDRKWVRRQVQAAVKYGHQLAAMCRRLAADLRAKHRVLASSALGTRRISSRKLNRLLRSARAHGLPAAIVTELMRLGVAPPAIRRARKLLPARAPAKATTILGPLLTPTIRAQLGAASDDLDVYLAGLAQAAAQL
jgi:hypothetical protein